MSPGKVSVDFLPAWHTLCQEARDLVRKAAEPGMVERIASFLADNALTQSWAQTMDRGVISPIERAMIGDEELKQQVSKLIRSKTPDDGVVSNQQIQAFDLLKGAPTNRVNLQTAVDESEDAAIEVGNQALAMMNKYATPRSRQQDVAGLLADGRVGLTQAGDNMRQFGLGSPVAAYSAVTAGGALATKAAIDGYGLWLAQQQQQAEKESKLPLTPP